MTTQVQHPGSRARSAIFAPLGDAGRAALVEQRLTDAIQAGLLVPGDRLPSEPELAGLLGVAVVTVREALIGLRARGLVVTTRGRGGGTVVAEGSLVDEDALVQRLGVLSRAELHDRADHYVLLLAGCAELAAERADAEEVDALRDLLPDLPEDDEAHDPGRWRHADAELWLSIAALSQSARLTREVVRAEADFGIVARIPFAAAGPAHAARERQSALLDALAAGDPDAARRCARALVRGTLDAVVRLHADAHARTRTPRSAS